MVKNRSGSKRVFTNRDIRAKEVRCIDHNNENVGIIPIYKAIEIAEDNNLDLVQVSSSHKDRIPTCKIIDYGKYKYELSKRNKDRAKKQRESIVKMKEIVFRPTTGIHDLRTKANRAKKFLEGGCKVKVTIKFKGRETSHKDVAEDRLDMFFDLLDVDVFFIDAPRMNGRVLTTLISQDKSAIKNNDVNEISA